MRTAGILQPGEFTAGLPVYPDAPRGREADLSVDPTARGATRQPSSPESGSEALVYRCGRDL